MTARGAALRSLPRVLRRENERERESKALARAAAWKAYAADDARHTAFDALVPGRVLDDLNPFDRPIADDGELNLDLPFELRLVAERGFVAPIDLRKVSFDFLPHQERIEPTRRTRVRRGRYAEHRE